MAPFQFHPNQVFNETKHRVDVAAKKYLEKATGDVHHLVPAEVIGDGNCLYNSILLSMHNQTVTASELRGIYNYLHLCYCPIYFEIIFSSNNYRTYNK